MTTSIQSKPKRGAAKFTYTPVILIGIAVIMLLSYFVLPWVEETELGAKTAQNITLNRDDNALDIPREALPLIPIAAIGTILLSAWALFNPKYERTTALMIALTGVMGAVYYVVYFRELGSNENDPLGFMGISFWLVLISSVLLIVQFLLPRIKYPKYELTRTLGNQESILAISLIGLFVIIGIINPRFVANRNIADILQGNAYIAVAAIGMSMVIITGNIDISVGSLIGVLAVISGRFAVDVTAMAHTQFGDDLGLLADLIILGSWVVPIIIAMGVEAIIGFLVAYVRIPSIVVTLGMLSILKGGLIVVTNGERVVDLPQAYFLAQQKPLGISTPIWLMIILTILAAIWMKYSSLGRSIYAVGGNAEVARLSGISERGVIMKVFIIQGFFIGIASLLYSTQLTIIQGTPPPSLELFIITAAVVGGVSILGGTGTVIGATLAALLLNAIRSAMVFINVSPFWIQAVQGVLILATVLADLIRRRRQML